ncbi:MAG: hypothetical protein LBT40_14005, partial [Deltaproteobacteria bacterium]|nr:hypothetical protein [Deltaproteobacteria bacterium]
PRLDEPSPGEAPAPLWTNPPPGKPAPRSGRTLSLGKTAPPWTAPAPQLSGHALPSADRLF